MDKEQHEPEERTDPPYEHEQEGFDYQAFFAEDDEELYEAEKEKRKKQKKAQSKIIGWILVLVLLINGLAIWPQVVNLPAAQFLAVSASLSQQDEIKQYKKSVVTIEWGGVKGTGFNIEPNGLIITNEHVVENANVVNVHFRAGESYVGKVIAKYPELDIAFVDIEAENLPTLSLTFEEKSWKKGEEVVFIGNPLSFTQIANEGEIIGETTLKDWEKPVMMIEAPIYRGNSGSPVINQEGEVVGVVFATLQNPSIESKEIIGVATPVSYLKEIVKKVTE
ncbi:trypsin-like peptidase domain-containing protein [Bacillus sp. DJP31]|uniref:S1 family peptidase n=1 Tax=Bacillus sp. DJP31 TaxID=3409789 RepID=UPI003BB493B2